MGTKKLKTFWFSSYNMQCYFHRCVFWFIVRKCRIGCALNPKNMSGFLAHEDMMVEKMVDKRFFEENIHLFG